MIRTTHAELFRQHSEELLSKLGFTLDKHQGAGGRYGETSSRYEHVSGLKLVIDFNPMERWAAISCGRIWSWPGTGYARISGRFSEFMETLGGPIPPQFMIEREATLKDIEQILEYLAGALPILGEGRELFPGEVYRVQREAEAYPGGAMYLPDYFETYDTLGLDPDQLDSMLRGFNMGWLWGLTAFESKIEDIGFYAQRTGARGEFYLMERRYLSMITYPYHFEYRRPDTLLGSYYQFGL